MCPIKNGNNRAAIDNIAVDTALPIARRNVSFSLDSSSCASPAKAPDAASARTIILGSSWKCIFVPYENNTINNMAIMIAGIR
jgi:hypothetical protein